MFLNRITIFFLFLILGLAFSARPIFASSTLGVIDATNKYVWASKAGWLNFDAAQGNVQVADLTLTGSVWSENFGWINLAPAKSGVKNDGQGNLSGYAWGENLGWINFSGVIVSSTGKFTGTAIGDNIGVINFDCAKCNVTTDWRPRAIRQQCNNAIDDDNDGKIDYPADHGCSSITDNDERDEGGGLPAGFGSAPTAPALGVFKISLNNGALETNTSTIIVDLFGGSDTRYVWLGEDENFYTGGRLNYDATKNFNTVGFILSGGEGVKTVYAKFCTQWGKCSETVEGSIIYKIGQEIIMPEQTEVEPQFQLSTSTTKETLSEKTVQIVKNVFDKTRQFLGQVGEKISEKIGARVPQVALNLPNFIKQTLPRFALNLPSLVSSSLLPTFTLNIPPISQMAALPGIENFSSQMALGNLIKQIAFILPEIKGIRNLPTTEVRFDNIVAREAPLALKNQWPSLPGKTLGQFVLAPLPAEISMLKTKLPELNKTFNSVGVQRLTDLTKLHNVNLTLPGLKQVTLNLAGQKLQPAEIQKLQTLPLNKLPEDIKSKLPTDLVFSQTMGATLDINTSLIVSTEGQVEQRIVTVSGKPLHLALKPELPVKNIKGYVIFRNRVPSAERRGESGLNLLAYLESLVFPQPALAYDQPQNIKLAEKLVLAEFEYADLDNDGIYTADLQVPIPEGDYEIISVMNYVDESLTPKAVKLVTVVDPEGYIYESVDDKEVRIPGAIVTLNWLNPATMKYEEWPAKDYQQLNPQVTDSRGSYSFLVPPGDYNLTISAPGYEDYLGKSFQVQDGVGVHTNIQLRSKYWWSQVIDWKTLILIITVLLLMYNFYKDYFREKSKQ